MIYSNLIKVAVLKQNEVLTEIIFKYPDFTVIVLENKVFTLLKQIKLNEHAIKLENSKQLWYRSIYILNLMQLKILKTYIKIHLKTGFI